MLVKIINYEMINMINVWVFVQFSTSLGCFCPQTFFPKNGLDILQWTSFISDLHTLLRIICRSVPDLENDSPCGVWYRGWTTYSFKWQIVWKLIIEINLSVCVCVSVNHELVRAINFHLFKLETPNLDQKCKTPWLKYRLFWQLLDLYLQGEIYL